MSLPTRHCKNVDAKHAFCGNMSQPMTTLSSVTNFQLAWHAPQLVPTTVIREWDRKHESTCRSDEVKQTAIPGFGNVAKKVKGGSFSKTLGQRFHSFDRNQRIIVGKTFEDDMSGAVKNCSQTKAI